MRATLQTRHLNLRRPGANAASSTLRPWAAVALALCLVGQVTNLGHLLLVQHTRCAEHGELVHASPQSHTGADVQPAASRSPSPSPSPSEFPSISKWTGSAGDGHEHCMCLTERRKLALAVASSVQLDPSTPLIIPPDDGQTAPSGAPLLRFAPKNSPPA